MATQDHDNYSSEYDRRFSDATLQQPLDIDSPSRQRMFLRSLKAYKKQKSRDQKSNFFSTSLSKLQQAL